MQDDTLAKMGAADAVVVDVAADVQKSKATTSDTATAVVAAADAAPAVPKPATASQGSTKSGRHQTVSWNATKNPDGGASRSDSESTSILPATVDDDDGSAIHWPTMALQAAARAHEGGAP